MANVMFFPFFGGRLLPYTETSKLKADSSSRKQWESFHQSVTLNSYRTDRIDVKQTINIICDKEKKDCFQTSSCMIYRSIQCDVLWRASTRFFHSSIKELLPPGRGPAVVAQQCPVGESLFLPPRRDSPSEWIFQAAWHLVKGLYSRADGGVSSCKQMHWVASTSDELLNEKIVLEKYIKHLFLNIWPLFLFFLYFWEAFPTKHAFF